MAKATDALKALHQSIRKLRHSRDVCISDTDVVYVILGCEGETPLLLLDCTNSVLRLAGAVIS